jgi:hypothetical protein
MKYQSRRYLLLRVLYRGYLDIMKCKEIGIKNAPHGPNTAPLKKG